MADTYSITIEAYDDVGKTVGKSSNNSGYLYLPKEWIGKKVRVILTEKPEE